MIPVDPPKDLPPQPSGSLEVVRGALRRAEVARGSGDMGVGVEAGPIEFYTGSGFIEVQVAVIVGPGNRVSIGLSPGFELPRGLLEPVLRGVELGALVRDRPGDIGEGVGYVGLLSRGRITRQDLTEYSIIMALLPWVNDYYKELPTLKEYRGLVEALRNS